LLQIEQAYAGTTTFVAGRFNCHALSVRGRAPDAWGVSRRGAHEASNHHRIPIAMMPFEPLAIEV
jgi:hypothetical protein